MERILDKNSTGMAGYLTKKLIKQSKWESCKILLKVGDVGIANDVYINVLSYGGLFMPSSHLMIFLVATLLFWILLR